LVYNYNKENLNFSVRVNNLLNTEYVLEQDSDIGKVITNNFRTGVGLSFNMKYSF
jgi:outer membrane receptor protein involved in Fe transport